MYRFKELEQFAERSFVTGLFFRCNPLYLYVDSKTFVFLSVIVPE